MHLGELAGNAVVTVKSDDLIDRAIDLMEDHQIRHLPVLVDGTPVGMVSDRDVLFHVGWQRISERESTRDPTVRVVGPTQIKEIMTTPLVTLRPDVSVARAARLMLDRRLHAVALASDVQVEGVVTETDFLKCYGEHRSIVSKDGWWRQEVASYMTRDLVCVEPREKTLAAVRLMQQRQIRHLPVVDDGQLVGIVSDRDLCRGMACDTVEKVKDPEPHIALMDHHGVQDLMSREVDFIAPTATLDEAAEQMLRRRFGSLPVTDENRLIGIITETDLLRAFLTAGENGI